MDDENIYSTKHLQDQKEHQAKKYWTKQKKNSRYWTKQQKVSKSVSQGQTTKSKIYIQGEIIIIGLKKKEYFVLYEKVPMIYP